MSQLRRNREDDVDNLDGTMERTSPLAAFTGRNVRARLSSALEDKDNLATNLQGIGAVPDSAPSNIDQSSILANNAAAIDAYHRLLLATGGLTQQAQLPTVILPPAGLPGTGMNMSAAAGLDLLNRHNIAVALSGPGATATATAYPLHPQHIRLDPACQLIEEQIANAWALQQHRDVSGYAENQIANPSLFAQHQQQVASLDIGNNTPALQQDLDGTIYKQQQPQILIQPAARDLHQAISSQSNVALSLNANQTLPAVAARSIVNPPVANAAFAGLAAASVQPSAEAKARLKPLPPCDDGDLKVYTERVCCPLATDEDENWLSEYLCFVRSDLIEVFRACKGDVASRINSKRVFHGQVGMRCRFCAHMPHNERASRSACFPSSLSRIYQSLQMILRDHFPKCSAMPEEMKEKFFSLKKTKAAQRATDSKKYWIDSALKLGMVDTTNGILISQATQAAALSAPPFGGETIFGVTTIAHQKNAQAPVLLVTPQDKKLVSEYMFTLMSQVQKVYLTESERVGNRKNLDIGLPGFGCIHCYKANRRGLSCVFPTRRRSLQARITDLYEHMRRCPLCPDDIKKKLATTLASAEDELGEKTFLDNVWTRLQAGTPFENVHSRG